jgi:hypothetical protein
MKWNGCFQVWTTGLEDPGNPGRGRDSIFSQAIGLSICSFILADDEKPLRRSI